MAAMPATPSPGRYASSRCWWARPAHWSGWRWPPCSRRTRIEQDLLGGFGSSLTEDAKALADGGVETVKKHAEEAARDIQGQLGAS